jgi:hypothetical protein
MKKTEITDKSNSNSLPFGEVGGALPYIDLYKQHHESIKKHSAGVMNDLRDDSFAFIEQLGFPRMHWRIINIPI